jgi:hypothetical protein
MRLFFKKMSIIFTNLTMDIVFRVIFKVSLRALAIDSRLFFFNFKKNLGMKQIFFFSYMKTSHNNFSRGRN